MKKLYKISILAVTSLLLMIVNSQAANQAINPSFTFSGFTLTAGTSQDLLLNFVTDSDAPSGAYSFSILAGNGASISGSNITGISAGTVTVTGSVSATAGYDDGSANAVITIVNQTPIASFSGFDLTVSGSNIDLNQYFSTNSSGTKTFFINGKSASLEGATLTGVNGGSVTVYAFVAPATGFNSVSATVTIPVYNQITTITFNGFNIGLLSGSTPGVNLSTLLSSNSPGAKSFTFDGDTNIAKLTGSTLFARALGSVTITGKIGKVNGYNAVTKTIVVNVVVSQVPQFTAPGTITGLFALVRRSASKQAVSISGTNLTGNITITSPVNLRISSDLVTVPGSRIVQTVVGGAADFQFNVQFANTNVATVVSGVITITSGSLRKTILVLGEVVSSTITGTTTGIEDELNGQQSDLLVYPNPLASGNTIYFNRQVSGVLINQEGRTVIDLFKEVELNTRKIVPGIYIFKSIEGTSLKIKIE